MNRALHLARHRVSVLQTFRGDLSHEYFASPGNQITGDKECQLVDPGSRDVKYIIVRVVHALRSTEYLV